MRQGLQITKTFQLPALAAILFFMMLISPALSQDVLSTTSLHPNVDYIKYQVSSDAGTVTVHMVTIDLDSIRDGSLVVEPVSGSATIGSCLTPSQVGQRTGAIAAMNGPYFGSAGGRTYPLGFTILNGKLAQLGNLNRPMIGFDRDGEFQIEVAHPKAFVTSETYFDPIWLWGINAPCGSDDVTMYDRAWGTTVSAQDGTVVAVGPLPENDPNVVNIGPETARAEVWDGVVTATATSGSLSIPENGYALVFRGQSESMAERYQTGTKTAVYGYEIPSGWEDFPWAVTLGPWFVHDGHYNDYSGETSYGGDITGGSNRSVIGITWNDELFFAVTRGANLNVREASDVLIDCNVRDAIMCDSGGSSALWADGIGAAGGSRAVPLSFIVRESSGDEGVESNIKVWTERLVRN
ncbi:MAG: phosphodiester glycosidase family protein [bacterium]|nr:phosphodiester glycosidase family protein [bacterium]